MNQMVKNLIAIRKKYKISQEEIADDFGIPTSSVSKIESGKRKVEFEYVKFFSDKFKLSLDDIANFHENNKGKNLHIASEPQIENSTNDQKLVSLKIERDALKQAVSYYETVSKSGQIMIDRLEAENEQLREDLKACKERKGA